MNTKRQIAIDKYIARPIAGLLNYAVRIAGKILSIDHNLSRPFERIAVCKFKGMGSIIQATPLLASLRDKFPTAKIIFVSTKSNQSLLEKIDLIDELVIVDDSTFGALIRSNLSALTRLIRLRPEVYLDLEIYSNYSVIFTALSLSKNRIGFYLRSNSFRMGIYSHMMYCNPNIPIADVYLQVGALLGCKTEGFGLYPFRGKPHQELESKEYIVINPNASDLRLERRWGAQNFVELSKQLLIKYPNSLLVFIGSGGERDYTEGIVGELGSEGVVNMAGRTSLEELIGIIAHGSLMITNDTGPMHIAFATNVPVVCLFGPCSPGQYGHHSKAYIVYKRVYCSPCVHDFTVPPCKGNNTCMQLISNIEVLQQVKLAFDKASPIPYDNTVVFTESDEVLGRVTR